MNEWFKCRKGVWIGPKEELSASGCCPWCGSLVEKTDIERHWKDVDLVEKGAYAWPPYKKTPMPPDWTPRPHPNYRAMWEWARTQPRCFSHIAHMRNAYKIVHNVFVDIEP